MVIEVSIPSADNQSHSCSAEVDNDWSLTSTPLRCLNDVHKDSFTFYSSKFIVFTSYLKKRNPAFFFILSPDLNGPFQTVLLLSLRLVLKILINSKHLVRSYTKDDSTCGQQKGSVFVLMPQGGVGKNEGGTARPELAHYDPALLWAPGNKYSITIYQ